MKRVDAELARLLQRTLGLNAHAVSPGSVEGAVEARMAEHGIRSRSRYLAILRCSRTERQSLVESIALPRVGFFQDPAPLESLRRWIIHHWLPRPSKKPLRVLSVPCATGEEPYSLAITLLELGLMNHQFHVDAVDINDRALRMAAGALYPAGSAGAATQLVRDRYFQHEPGGLRLCPSVRGQVSLLKTDLLESRSLEKDYDIIFGRSLMMYFSARAQERIVRRLERLLKPGGLLIVGPRIGPGKARVPMPAWTDVLNEARNRSSAGEVGVSRESVDGKLLTDEKSRLKQAHDLLDLQRFNEATAICVNLLADHRACATAVCLLGRIAQAEGRVVEAREFYRRAIYLQPRLRQAHQLLTLCPPWGSKSSRRRR